MNLCCKTCNDASLRGHLKCLKYSHENGRSKASFGAKGAPWDKRTCSYAAFYGHLDCLIYAHENGCPWNELTCANAASNGHLNCLVYAVENGCSWDEKEPIKKIHKLMN